MTKLFHLAVLALLPIAAWPISSGDLDASFGVGGWVTTDIESGSYDQFGATVVQPDGKLIVAGYRNISGGNQLAVVRYLDNGDLDDTFGVGGKVILNAHLNEFVTDVKLQDDGKILIAGMGDGITDRAFLVRLTTAGELDTSFDDDGIVAINFGFNDAFRDILEVTDSRILVAGTGGLAQFNLDGSLDTGFGGGDGILPLEEPQIEGRPVSTRSSALQSSGKVVAVGSYLPNLQPAQVVLQRYNLDGSLDQTFGTGGLIVFDVGSGEDTGNKLIVDSTDRIIVVGRTNDGGGTGDDLLLIRRNSDGSVDTGFGSNGIVVTDIGTPNDFLTDVVIQGGSYLVSGYVFDDVALALYGADGSLNASFGDGGVKILDSGFSDDGQRTNVAIDHLGRAYIVGFANSDFLVGRVSLQSGAIRGDFDRDLDADLLLRNTQTGSWHLINIQELGSASNAALGVFNASSWTHQTNADFDADGDMDVLIRRSDGAWRVFEIEDGVVVGFAPMNLFQNLSWEFRAANDFDGDGDADILARKTDTGQWRIFRIQNLQVASSAGVAIFQSPSWAFQSAADYDGDGDGDVLLRRSSTGLWQMFEINDRAVASKAGPGSLFNGSDWQHVASGDMDKDGTADIVLRSQASGAWRLFQMADRSVVSVQSLNLYGNLLWVHAQTGDFDADGDQDILLRKSSDGRWRMFDIEGLQSIGNHEPGIWQHSKFQVQDIAPSP